MRVPRLLITPLLLSLALVGGPAWASPQKDGWESTYESGHPEPVSARVVAPLGTAVGTDAHRARIVNHSAWSWYMDPRTLETARATYVGAMSNAGGVTLTRIAHGTSALQHRVLQSGMNDDDHNAPALLELPDGRIAALWSGHNRSPLRLAVTTRGDSLTYMSAPRALTGSGLESAGASYAHWLYLPGTSRPFVALTRRDGDFAWVLTRSADLVTWTPAVPLLERVYDADQEHPYLKFATDGKAIHVLATDRHPSRGSTSLYHFVIRGSRVERTDGSLICLTSELMAGRRVTVDEATLVYDGQSADGRPRIYDISVAPDGQPRVAVTTIAGINYTYKWGMPSATGAWRLRTLARQSGTYPAGMSLDHEDSGRVLLAQQLGSAALVEYRTPDDGQSWTSRTRTSMSGLRTPTTPFGNGGPFGEFWLGGSYTNYYTFDTQVWGMTSGSSPVQLVSSWSSAWDDGGTVVGKTRAGIAGPSVAGRIVQLRITPPGSVERTIASRTTDTYGNVRFAVPNVSRGTKARLVVPSADGWGYAASPSVRADS